MLGHQAHMSRKYAIFEYIMHAPGLLHIGGAAYFVWASPPNGGGEPRNAGRIGVGHVLYGAKFNHEFSPPTEDRPTWDSGPKAA
jgi:hypothetical protein